jgi:cell division septal protein FtsQ
MVVKSLQDEVHGCALCLLVVAVTWLAPLELLAPLEVVSLSGSSSTTKHHRQWQLLNDGP